MKKLDKDVLFLWIPKNAGTSIYNILKKYGCKKLDDHLIFDKFKNKGVVTFGHISLMSLIDVKVITEDYFNKSFKFCIIRNPWDRVVSLFHYLRLNKVISFEKFIESLELGLPPVGIYNRHGLSQANQQVDWIFDERGNRLVNYIMRFENLEEDSKKLFEILGIDEKMVHSNKSKHKNYREYYTPDLKERVAKLYSKDIECFGYKF